MAFLVDNMYVPLTMSKATNENYLCKFEAIMYYTYNIIQTACGYELASAMIDSVLIGYHLIPHK